VFVAHGRVGDRWVCGWCGRGVSDCSVAGYACMGSCAIQESRCGSGSDSEKHDWLCGILLGACGDESVGEIVADYGEQRPTTDDACKRDR
jgi:hypothetical protein